MPDKTMTADDVLALDDVEYATIPGLKAGQMMRIKSLTAGDFIEWSEARDADPIAKRVAGLNLIIKSAVDDAGAPILNEGHLERMKKVRHRVTEAVIKEILRLNGMTVKQEAEAKKD